MIRRLIAISTVISLVSTSGVVAFAQSFGNSGLRGGTGGSGFGSGMGSSGFGGGMGSSGFGGGMGSSGFGGGMGSSGFGSGMGSSGFGGGTGGSGFGSSGNSGFGNSSGYGAVGAQNFIGRDAGDMQATFGQMGKALNTMNRNMSMNRNNSRKSAKQTAHNNAGQPMRVAVKVAFATPRPSSDQMAAVIRTRLSKILTERHMSQTTFTMDGDTAVVSGVAASENERDVISQILAIEPGIRNVRNEMTIGQPAGG